MKQNVLGSKCYWHGMVMQNSNYAMDELMNCVNGVVNETVNEHETVENDEKVMNKSGWFMNL